MGSDSFSYQSQLSFFWQSHFQVGHAIPSPLNVGKVFLKNFKCFIRPGESKKTKILNDDFSLNFQPNFALFFFANKNVWVGVCQGKGGGAMPMEAGKLI